VALVIVFGAATLLTRDVRFLMAKPTVVYLILAVVMLKPGWMVRYLPPAAEGRGQDLMTVFGFIWAGLMALTAGLNLLFAIAAPELWPGFLAIFPLASKGVLFAIQYTTMRLLIRRSMNRERQASLKNEAPLRVGNRHDNAADPETGGAT
jgi:intracellular septation protein